MIERHKKTDRFKGTKSNKTYRDARTRKGKIKGICKTKKRQTDRLMVTRK